MSIRTDRKYINGKIYTLRSEGECFWGFCVSGGRFSAVFNREEADNYTAAETIDLQGKTVLPGFIDCHQHTLEYAKTLMEVNLRDASTKEELLAKISEKALHTPAGEWIKGSGFDHEKFPDKAFPTAAELDKAAPHNPVVISRYCVHFHVANTMAMKLAGVEGKPLGLLRESEVTPVMNIIPDMLSDSKKRRESMKAVMHELNSCGITGIHATEAPISKVYEDFGLYQELAENGELTVRVYYCPASLPNPNMKTGFGNDMIKLGFYKMFADGSLGPRTAALSEPYSDMPESKGVLNDPEQIRRDMKIAYDSGMQIGIHAIGDKGIETALDSMELCYNANPRPDPRFRIIHGMCMRPDLLKRAKALNAIVDIQPGFTSNNNIWWSDDRLGPKRISYAYAWKTLIDAGLTLTGSSDSPVEDFSPLLGIYSVVCRRDRKGLPEKGWMPWECVSVYEAACMYTKNAAYSSYEEKLKGTIETGKLADYVILAEDIFNIDPMKIRHVAVCETCMGGKTVYRKDN